MIVTLICQVLEIMFVVMMMDISMANLLMMVMVMIAKVVVVTGLVINDGWAIEQQGGGGEGGFGSVGEDTRSVTPF